MEVEWVVLVFGRWSRIFRSALSCGGYLYEREEALQNIGLAIPI
jgi:hypothetical protein